LTNWHVGMFRCKAHSLVYSNLMQMLTKNANKINHYFTHTKNSEQLSAQDHYDYGMRAVKTVIVAAGNLKRAEPDTNEEVLILRALQDVNLPKFLSHDLPLFKGIISDLFPGLSRPEIDYGQLSQCLKLSIEAMKLQAVPFFIEKSVQLYETIVVRHGLMLVGPTGGGKSCNVQCLEATLGMLKKRGVEGFAFENVIRHSVNPKAITMGQLYGEFDANTHEWQDGVLANLVRECAKSTTPDRKWIMFDGPVDAIWIENMVSFLRWSYRCILSLAMKFHLREFSSILFFFFPKCSDR
jgi:dynein heavy chain